MGPQWAMYFCMLDGTELKKETDTDIWYCPSCQAPYMDAFLWHATRAVQDLRESLAERSKELEISDENLHRTPSP